jgi:two-component system sensor histidine kinase YesM
MLPVCTLGVMGPVLYARSMEQQVIDHTLRMIAQVDRNLEYLIINIEKLFALLESYEPTRIFFFNDRKVQPEIHKNALDFMDMCMKTHKEIAGIMLLAADDRMLTNHYARITRDPLTLEPWYLKALGSTASISIISRPIGRNIRSLFDLGADDVVSIVKPIYDEGNFHKPAGVILIDLKLESIQELLADSSLGRDGYLYISDQKGELVFAPLNTTVYRIAPRQLQPQSGKILRRYNNEIFHILYKQSSYTGWTTAGVFSVQSALREVSLIRWYAIVVGSITVISALVLSVIFAASIARPVEKLQSLMQLAETGNFSIRFTENRMDEIGQLGQSFNRMIEKISDLIEEVYREQQRKREIELRVLQEQIKPHFLYNTLDTIQWMAQEKNAQDIVHIVVALTRLFRVGLSKGQEMIPLSEEIKHVESYLYIQKIRYEDRFDYDIEIEEGLEHFRVLKVILQPLVENSIYHGIKERRGKGHIWVQAQKSDRDLVFVVKDNGIGMSEDRLAQLQEYFTRDSYHFHDHPADWGTEGHIGFGARNVHERILLTFGEGYGIRYTSMLGQGTTVLLRHPIVEEEPICIK